MKQKTRVSEGLWGMSQGTSQIMRAHNSTSGKNSRIVKQPMNFFRKPR
ncbi:MAG: hypothetical protein MRY57_02515 [Candidatus Pacebacteria bacterium]|nr:hypothetical protein [Candidatus Paceibacterota bacterium]